MNMRLAKVISVIITVTVLLSCISVSAAGNIKLQLFFAPQILNDTTGELVVDVNVKNFNSAVHKSYGDICAVTFMFEYNDEQFTIKKNEDGTIQTIVDDKTLVKSLKDIETEVNNNGVVSYTFMDSTLDSNLISKDGTLFRFTLVAKNPKGFWNSDNRYSLRFVPGSIGVVTYDLSRYKVGTFYDVEGIDVSYGPYNYSPTLITPNVDKYLTFTGGENGVKVNDLTVETDAFPFVQDDVWMIPVRYLSENIGMSVEWDGEAMMASSYAEYKTLKIMAETNTVYINSAKYNASVAPVTVDGRIYIPTDVVTALYPESQITESGGSVTIYIP